MKKSIKIISILLIALMMLTTVTPVFAAAFTPKDINTTTSVNEANSIKKVGNSVTSIIRLVGTVIAVVILIVLGIKYMMGSAEEKAEYKKTLFPYIVGAVLIFAASNLADIVYKWASSVGE